MDPEPKTAEMTDAAFWLEIRRIALALSALIARRYLKH